MEPPPTKTKIKNKILIPLQPPCKRVTTPLIHSIKGGGLRIFSNLINGKILCTPPELFKICCLEEFLMKMLHVYNKDDKVLTSNRTVTV